MDKTNTNFNDYWEALNAALLKAGVAEATFYEARGAFEDGASVEAALPVFIQNSPTEEK